MRATAVRAVLILSLPGCAALLESVGISSDGGSGGFAGIDFSDPLDGVLGVLQVGSVALGGPAVAAAVLAIRRVRKMSHEPSRASGWIERLERRLDRLELALMTAGALSSAMLERELRRDP